VVPCFSASAHKAASWLFDIFKTDFFNVLNPLNPFRSALMHLIGFGAV
jgi:hypothetical protein